MLRVIVMFVCILIVYISGSILFDINPTWQEIVLVLGAAFVGDAVYEMVKGWQEERHHE